MTVVKKIILIGDSIRIGYDKYVKDALKDKAEVFYPSENCRFAQYVLRTVCERMLIWYIGMRDFGILCAFTETTR